MVFPTTWKMLNNKPNEIEILQNETNEGTMVTSFICVNEKEYIDLLETSLDTLVKTNIEREEKEKLFKSKVQELKSIFDKEKLENLKSLKFDIEELTKYLENEEPKNVERAAETTENV
jgi:hypothetical protein